MKPTSTPLIRFPRLLLSILLASPLAAATFTWTGAGDSDSWANLENWAEAPAAAPGASDEVVFHAPEATRLDTSTLGANRSISRLTFNGDATEPVTLTASSASYLTLGAGGLSVLAGDHKLTGSKGSGNSQDFRFLNLASHTLDIQAGASFQIDGRVRHSGANSYIKTGGGTLIFSANNAGADGWNINTFTVAAGSARWAAAGATGLSANNWTISNGAVAEIAANQLFNNGVIRINGSGSDGEGVLRSFSGIRQITGSGSGGLTIGSTSRIGVDADTLTIGIVLSGASGRTLTKGGQGKLVLNAANVFNGNTRIAAGTLQATNSGAFANTTLELAADDSGILSFGTLAAATAGGLTGTRPLVLENDEAVALTLTVGGNNASTSYDGILSGAGTLVKTGSGILTLAGNNTFGTGATLQVGITTGNNSGAIHLASATALGNVSTVNLNGGSGGVSRLELSGGHDFGSADILTRGRPSQRGAGAVIANMDGDNTWNGSITINNGGGGYGVVSNQDLLTLNGDLVNALNLSRTWEIGGAGDVLINGVIRQTETAEVASILKFGSGTLTLSAANTYPGNTTVTEGTLVMAATASFDNSPTITIEEAGTLDVLAWNPAGYPFTSSQTLAGTGSVLGNASVAGTVAPGLSVGTLTFDGNLDLAPGSVFKADGETGSASQVETAMAQGSVSASGIVIATVTDAISGAPTVVEVPVFEADTPEIWASRARETLEKNDTIATIYQVGGTGAEITLTRLGSAANDPSLNIGLANGDPNPGIVEAPVSADITPGMVPTADRLAVSGALDITGAALELAFNGTPDAPFYVIATHGASLTGSFASVTGLPAGYEINYSHDGGTAIALVAGSSGNNYASWAAVNAGNQGPHLDFDNDGIPNLIEYALLLDPAGFDPAGTFTGTGVSFTKRPEAVANNDVSYTIQVSQTLEPNSWITAAPVTENNNTISYSLPTNQGRVFVRLMVKKKP